MKETSEYDGVERPTFVIKEHILRSLFDRMCALGGISSMSFMDFLSL
jgi:hypothetical protein